jgi:hypothetical protein
MVTFSLGLHRVWIASPMIFDLEAQEFVNGGQCLCVIGAETHPSARFALFKLIFDLGFELLQHRHTGRRLRVNEHGSLEIACRKFLGDVLQVLLDQVAAGGVLCVIGSDLNTAAIFFEQKMVCGLFMRKAHDFIAAFVDRGMVRTVVVLFSLLCADIAGEGQKGYAQHPA